MATPKKTVAPKLTKADPLFYSKIGAKGGKSTLKKLGKKHFKAAAILSHRNREHSTKPALPESESDSLAGPRDKAKRRAK
jgi:hypothetical protein